MYRSIILPQAQKDIQESAMWYNKVQKGLGKRFTSKVREKVLFIEQNPNACNIRYDNVRTALLNIFPFMLQISEMGGSYDL